MVALRRPRFTRRTGAVLALLAAVAGGCSGPPDTPTAVVEAFYEVRIDSGTAGVPNAAELAQLAPYLSDELAALLRQARELHDTEAARAPGEKPAFADGDLFSSLFEGPTSFTVGVDEVVGDQHRISVQLAYDRQQPVVSWTDKVVVKAENGRPVIRDIEYGGQWEFGNKGSLVAVLKKALAPQVAAGLLGKWVVAGHRVAGVSAMNDVQARALHGQAIEYAPETAMSGKDVCPHASYVARREAAGPYLATGFRADPLKLGLQPDTMLDITDVACGGLHWATLGGTLFISPAGRAFAPLDGVFFELQRR
jgi:hypothetical protein